MKGKQINFLWLQLIKYIIEPIKMEAGLPKERKNISILRKLVECELVVLNNCYLLLWNLSYIWENLHDFLFSNSEQLF